MHFHSPSAIGTFSAGDLWGMQLTFNVTRLKQITSQYLYCGLDSSTYAMAIDDSTSFSRFLIDHPLAGTMDPTTHEFDTTTNIGRDFERAYNQLIAAPLSLSIEDAYTQAMAYIMSKYNTGLLLYRQRRGETKFRKINTKVTISSGNETYTVNNCQ